MVTVQSRWVNTSGGPSFVMPNNLNNNSPQLLCQPEQFPD